MTVQIVNNQTILGGIEGKMLQCLADKLNFEIEIFMLPNAQFGSRHSNGTWDGVIGLVESGEADIGVQSLSISEERMTAVDFSIPYFALQKAFTAKEPGLMPKITAFTYPFSMNAWILYVLMILVVTVLFQRVIFRNKTILGSFLWVLGSIISQPMGNIRDTPWRRVLLGFWLAIAVAMPFFYKTSFLSFLTKPEKEPVPRTFEELSRAVLNAKYKCLTHKGTIDKQLLRESKNEYMVKLGEIIEKNDWEFSLDERVQDLLDEPVALITTRGAMRLFFGSPPYINVRESDDNLGIWYAGIAVNKEFCCRELLNDVLHRINNGGFLNKWLNDNAFAGTLKNRLEVEYEEPELQLKLQDLKLAFFTLFSGYALAFLAFLAELLIPKRFVPQ
ncbi:lig_chan-Glu_bd domain-containing protein [Nephila pilipes]|uniref:Lig_chan-Glu_bd domain-containing protein n=1 Tax=Nephila pilipes TaxID=299642 RepID=A0A8X6NX12_NEPPI|nr:lig_chan-Glu_bd domain-containing protein [Nephila pilipes]GFT37884.1 lig_chan-Glu_bd domain-containing protein [Nephila pilipes]GFU36354.1 lig_chan-Glu_bd domain-containing protein [Nephila pilipes]